MESLRAGWVPRNWTGRLSTPSRARAGTVGRIAILIHDLRGGGAERMALNLAKGMLEAGQDVDLVLVRATGPYLDQIPPGVRLVDLDRKNVLSAVPALVRYLRQERPVAVFSNLTHINVAALLAKIFAGGESRIVVTEHSVISIKARAPKSVRTWLTHHAVPLLYGLADQVVAVSQGAADDLARFARLPRSRVKCIYNPVYNDLLMDASKARVEHPWLQPGQPPVILAAGRLHALKGFDVLMRAFEIVRRTTACKLIIIGEGEERQRLEGLANSLSISRDVSLMGFVRNPYAMMSRAAAFVVSSQWEGFSVVLLEALACGAPVVSTDCAGGPSEILEKGRYGVLVPVDDAVAMAAGIVEALQKPRGIHAERAKAFSTQAATQDYLEILKPSLKRHAGYPLKGQEI